MGSVTLTGVSATSPVFVTVMVKLAVPPLTTAWVEGVLVTEIAGIEGIGISVSIVSQEHFDFVPFDKAKIYYDINKWYVSHKTGKAVYYRSETKSMLVAYKEVLLSYLNTLLGIARSKRGKKR